VLIRGQLARETLALTDAQSVEPECLVLRALIDCMSPEDENLDNSPLNFNRFVPLRELTASIWENQRISLRPEQVGAIARDLGLETRISHGVTKVAPTPATLLGACEGLGYEDEAIADLKRQLTEGGTKNDG
jgi:hypothetical protein